MSNVSRTGAERRYDVVRYSAKTPSSCNLQTYYILVSSPQFSARVISTCLRNHYRLLLLTHNCCRSGYCLKTPDQVIRKFSFTAYSRLYQWRRREKTSSQSCHRPEQHRVTSIASRTVGYLYELCIHLDRPLLKYFAIPHGSPALDTVGEHVNLNAPM